MGAGADGDGGTGTDGEVEPVDPDELPTSDIEVEASIHFLMKGTFPMRIAEVFFTPRGIYFAEHSYITPLMGLGARKHRRNARAMQEMYDTFGIDAVLLHADRVLWLDYELLDRLVLYSGGRFGRPKLTAYSTDGPSYAYRAIGDRDFEELAAGIRRIAERHGLDLSVRDAVGFTPRRNVARFFDREPSPGDE